MDKELQCKACGAQFIFSSSEQEFFRKKNLQNEPKHCPDCRLTFRQWRKALSGEKKEPEITDVICALCGCATKVPFKPRGLGPMYCYGCLHKVKEASVAKESIED